MIEALKEEYETSQNSLLGKLSEKKKREQELKAKFLKRLHGVKGIADLLSQCVENEKGYLTFYTRVNELMKVDRLTKGMLDDLLEIVNMNYNGIVIFLQKNYGLSKGQLILCCFVCSGFSRLEASVIYGIAPNAFDSRCYRLKEKIGTELALPLFLKKTVVRLGEGKL